MTDNDLISRLVAAINVIIENDTNLGPDSGVVVQQKQQPTQQGTPLAPASVFVERLFDHRYGSPRIGYEARSAGMLTEGESQIYETTFQISALKRIDPRNPMSITAPDLCNIVCLALQSRAIIRRLSEDDVGMLRVSEVRNLYFTNENDVQEAHPSFDLVLTYEREFSAPIPELMPPATFGLYPV
jgi:hypothetical protein